MKGVVENDECYLSEVPMLTDADKNFLLNQKTEQAAVFESFAGDLLPYLGTAHN